LKKIAKFVGYASVLLAGCALLYAAATYILPRITIEKEPNSAAEVTIYILTNGVHTDIVVPTRNAVTDWSQEIKYANAVAADTSAPYLAMGWGDKEFYLDTPSWAELKYSVAFRAAFALSTTAIHATYYAGMTESKSCKKIMISIAQYRRLVNYMTNSFKKDAKGHCINIKTTANYGKTDAFYEAIGSYSLFHTCNTWANNALKTSGQRCCLWTPFDTGIFAKYE
jgi:uncharacterized protein (TIGR02117 family)